MKFLTFLFRPIFHFFTLFFTNKIIMKFPIRGVRLFWLKYIMRMKVGKKTFIDMDSYFMQPWKIKIGNHTHVNRDCFIDARNNISIGDSVSISHRVNLVTGAHDVNDEKFKYKGAPIIIGDYVFIGVGATVLQGVEIGKGAVICANACVTKNVPPFSIVAGIPAKVIGKRNESLNYTCNPQTFFC